MIKVLFVCLGNICRSPMADAIFQHQVRAAGLETQIEVDSAGTGAWHVGEEAHPGTLKLLQKYEVPYAGRARQIALEDFETYDYILAMDQENLAGIMRLINRAERTAQEKLDHFYNKSRQPEIALFLSYAKRAGMVEETEVPDPYYDGRFEQVYDLVLKGCTALLAHIRQVHRL